ncbi:MAG: YiiX/YebB-like N1pC/P60 family cysteine hydrolase [Myxococcota bacterium]
MRRVHAPALLLTLALAVPASAGDLADVRTGDVIFHESRSNQSALLKIATGSRYTHVGLVAVRDGAPWVIEAVQPVKWTPLHAWVARGVDRHAVVMRPTQPLSEAQASRVVAAAEAHLGKPYDLGFRWSDERMYCSELVFKAYRDGAGVELAPTRLHSEYTLSDPRVKKAIAARYPTGIPTDEPVVAPSDLMESSALVEVVRAP